MAGPFTHGAHAERSCPACHKRVNAWGSTDPGTPSPQPGDLSLCTSCGAVLRFAAPMPTLVQVGPSDLSTVEMQAIAGLVEALERSGAPMPRLGDALERSDSTLICPLGSITVGPGDKIPRDAMPKIAHFECRLCGVDRVCQLDEQGLIASTGEPWPSGPCYGPAGEERPDCQGARWRRLT